MVQVCPWMIESDYDPDIQALLDKFAPRALALEGVVAPLPLEGARSEREEEIKETLTQRGGGSANLDVEKKEEWKIIKRARKN